MSGLVPPPLTWLTPAETAWREQVRDFAERVVRPAAAEMDATAAVAPEVARGLFEHGLMGIEVPTAYGGGGRDHFESVLAIEEVARVDPGCAVCVDVQNVLVIQALLGWGSGNQKRRYLPLLARRMTGAFALSETGAGSDAFALRTVASPGDGGYVLSGRKRWTSNAAAADLFVVFARLAQDEADGRSAPITAFLVERTAPGLTVAARTDQLGVRAAATAEVILDGVPVRPQQVLGQPGEAAQIAIDLLTVGRVGIAAQLLGLARGALEEAVRYAQERQQFGRRIAQFQAVQFTLAQMAAEIEAVRVLVYNAARLVQHGAGGDERTRAAAIAKYQAALVAERAASAAVEVLGGNGFVKGSVVEKLYRDAKAGSIYEGTTNMQLRTIASTLLRAPERRIQAAACGRAAGEAG